MAWLVPVHSLLALDVVPRFVAATVLAFTPIFIANLVFAERFRNVEESNIAFGANLLGAMVGGVLEYVSLVTGYQTLLLLWHCCMARRSSAARCWPAGAPR